MAHAPLDAQAHAAVEILPIGADPFPTAPAATATLMLCQDSKRSLGSSGDTSHDFSISGIDGFNNSTGKARHAVIQPCGIKKTHGSFQSVAPATQLMKPDVVVRLERLQLLPDGTSTNTEHPPQLLTGVKLAVL
ncbi:hypothetical protein TUM18999_07880 [Pseudomonas tohonis]|uniref:Uncharacterized protein n=1 Tax=Pseudomonas tohonis TaxID=2725477 RepID=A0A6J4DYL2_9PSED|nr:hypothetical protein TUM18999_07880 [Pseudomonas tohonis]GJN54863.1 hypothetical protein TUM20286_46150 [Pseudomonas tohonis]